MEKERKEREKGKRRDYGREEREEGRVRSGGM